MNKKEQDLNCQCVVKMKNCVVETWDPGEGPSFPKQFTFDSTYDQDSNTENIYNDICYPLVEVWWLDFFAHSYYCHLKKISSVFTSC